MRFSDLIGQEKLAQHLIETEKRGRTAHAQIFIGSEGRGGLPLALAYAQYLQCEQPLPQDACGQCSACRKMQKFQHLDLHFAFPVIGTNKTSEDFLKEWREAILENPYIKISDWLRAMEAENQQPNLNKQECLRIVRKLSLTKSEGRYKIMILWLPEYLDKEGNRLLKLIEEPEPYTIFILVAEQPDKILNTILSRCQPVNLPPIDLIALEKGLKNLGLSEIQAQQIARRSEGSWTRAMQIWRRSGQDWSKHWLAWLRLCIKPEGFAKNLYQWVEEVIGEEKWGRKDLLEWIQYGAFFLRETLHTDILKQSPALEGQEADLARELKLNLQSCAKLLQFLDETAYYVERNAQPKILLMNLGIGFGKILQKKSF